MEYGNLKNIAAAVGKFQSLCPAIPKDKDGYKYKYAELSTIVKIITPLLKECELTYIQPVSSNEDCVIVKTLLIHSSSGEYIESDISAGMKSAGNNNKLTDVQSMGAVITYLRRYSLSSILGIVTEDDNDGNNVGVDYNKRSYNSKKFTNQSTVKSKINDIKINKESTNPEDEAIEKLLSANNMDDLKKIFSLLGNQKGNPNVIQCKNDLKLKFEDVI